MDPVDFPFQNHKPLPKPNWAWSADTVYPADEPEPPCPMSTMRTPCPRCGPTTSKGGLNDE